MVQGGLLTAHPGSVHGDGEAPGGESFLRQGAGTTSPGSPDLETAAAVAEQRRDREKGFSPRGFPYGGKYRRKGQTGGRHHLRTRHQGAWGPGGSPLAPT